MASTCSAQGKAKRLLIAGADPSVTKDDLVPRLGGKRSLFACCVDLGSESVDTRSNAEEARALARPAQVSLSCGWSPATGTCAARAMSSASALGDDYRIVPDAVRTEPELHDPVRRI